MIRTCDDHAYRGDGECPECLKNEEGMEERPLRPRVIPSTRKITFQMFLLMQADALRNCHGSDRHADAYYEILELLKLNRVTHIGSEPLEDFK